MSVVKLIKNKKIRLSRDFRQPDFRFHRIFFDFKKDWFGLHLIYVCFVNNPVPVFVQLSSVDPDFGHIPFLFQPKVYYNDTIDLAILSHQILAPFIWVLFWLKQKALSITEGALLVNKKAYLRAAAAA
ncbi:hypothetical protein [Peribacillus frigoritolerans]|uniref:hypothetical protein n=1 Tax=Peribacillus castrilensis TaxID=2897690 RepID=UPI003DA69660